jgi:hypothetical protein
MLKFIVVRYRRPDWTRAQLRRYFEDVHGTLATAIPGLLRSVQNYVESR